MSEPTTITIPVEVELDAVHAPAWEQIVAASTDEDAARETVGQFIAQSADIESAVYQVHRRLDQQRQQVGAQMAAQLGDMEGADETDNAE